MLRRIVCAYSGNLTKYRIYCDNDADIYDTTFVGDPAKPGHVTCSEGNVNKKK